MKRKQSQTLESKPNKKQKTDQDSTSLIREVQKGDMEEAIKLIKSGISINGKNKSGQTPLSIAARIGDMNLLKELISHQVDVKSSNFPLVEAIIAQHMDVVKFLVENGMNPKIRIDSSASPLFQASKEGNFDIVKYLLECGSDPNEKDEKTGSTCLIEATKQNYTDCIELLVQFGADMNQVDKSKLSPLHYAIQKQFLIAVKLLLNTDGELELFTNLAASLKSKEILEILIDSGFDINGQDLHGNSTLILAIERENWDSANLLLERGVNIHHVNESDRDAILFAARHGNLIREIFMNGGSLERNYPNGSNLLSIALWVNTSHENVKFLLSNGMVLGVPRNYYPDPLTLEFVMKFVKTDSYAFQSPNFNYKVSTIPIRDLLFYSIIYNKFDIFVDLIWKFKSNEIYWGGNGLLHLCIIYVRNEMFDYLIKNFPMNYLWRNEENLLPIDVAIKKGNEDLTMKLCQIHGNIFPIDSNFFKCSRIHEDIWDLLQCWKIFKSCESCRDIQFIFQ
jgi:ankyrin repeat protein